MNAPPVIFADAKLGVLPVPLLPSSMAGLGVYLVRLPEIGRRADQWSDFRREAHEAHLHLCPAHSVPQPSI